MRFIQWSRDILFRGKTKKIKVFSCDTDLDQHWNYVKTGNLLKQIVVKNICCKYDYNVNVRGNNYKDFNF